MGRKSVTVLDVRSSEITIAVGERGINNTFVFGAMQTEQYEGYGDGVFFDEKSLRDAVVRAIQGAERATGERVKELFVGVPGEFISVIRKEHAVSYPKRRRITEREVSDLFEAGKEERTGYRFIRATSMVFTTADNRRVVDPIDIMTTSLHARLSYYYATEYFVGIFETIFESAKVKLRFLPAEFATASYLIPPETRDEYAILLDMGNYSTTLCVMLGGGVYYQRSCWAGKAQISLMLAEKLHLEDPAVADYLLSRFSLFTKDGAEKTEVMYRGVNYVVDSKELAACVTDGLDVLWEAVAAFLDECAIKEIDNKPLLITGDGVLGIRGALEYLTRRFDRPCEVIAPDLPYYNKPSMSSRIALVDMAYEDRLRGGLFYRIRNGG